ncbi:hypothetical protein NQ318_010584 [Aromia moschata]|uniref:DNA-directed DNA polymerase n=1 Tax=Aromia moschata TaxID=1265417 RepID=A0AAV8XB77_9CUCU|nr:hypothetical protein NQ318_010584 [Aromia moschata]
MLTKKGVYPYYFMDSFNKFNYLELPAKDEFYNRLEEKHISSEQHEHVQRVWCEFDILNLGEYTDLYLKTDILLLCDFIASCLKTYHLDPAHYYTFPGYTWNCMLKYTKEELELLTDVHQLNFVRRGIRGGLSHCSKRRATANNKYMKEKI